jgi:uncharacterized protein (DUF58 family)
VLRATRPGWCFVAIILGVGFAALNTGNNLLYLVFALMLAFLILSGILSETSLRGIRVERRVPRELFAGAPNPVVLRIHNRQKRVAAFALSVEDRVESAEALRPVGRCFVLRVGPRTSVDRSYAFSPDSRGRHAFASVRVSTRFPFGLFVKSVDLELPGEVLVYPALRAVVGARVEETGRRAVHERPGRSRTGDALASVREFVRGDTAARVHWRRSLTSGRLVVGERDGHTAAELEVLLQLAPEMAPERIEERVSLAASEIVHHLAAGHRVGLRTRSTRFAPDGGPAHRRTLLRFLALVDVEPASSRERERVEVAAPRRQTDEGKP